MKPKRSFLTAILVFVSSIIILEISYHLGNLQAQTLCSAASSQTEDNIWQIVDVINPTLDDVEWIEEGNYSEPPSWISDGRWYEAHSRQTLVRSDDIFVSLSEVFNWTAVNASLLFPYSSFEKFRDDITGNPSWWLKYSWNLDVDWHGIPLNRTKVTTEFDADTFTAEVYIWCHVTNIPEYIMGEKRLETWLTGFDLTAISVGKLEALQWYEDYTPTGRYYYIYFKAPANILSQYTDTYSFELDVSPSFQNKTYNVEQEIQISMPSNTEVKSASPSNMYASNGNIVTFTIYHGDRYPKSFTVTSGPPTKDITQGFLESAARWIAEPTVWVAFGTLTVLLYTAFRGKRTWSRRNTYYRLYKSMINTYDRHYLNPTQFNQEMENLSRSITQYFIEDKIGDEQFEKLLARRDDLTERAAKQTKEHSCPTCGQPLAYISQYQRWYCQNCKKYT